jgi:hypothetical protein
MQFRRPRTAKRRTATGRLPLVWLAVVCLHAPAAYFLTATAASALSEIGREELPPPMAQGDSGTRPGTAIPSPNPIQTTPPDSDEPADEDDEPAEEDEEPADLARPSIDEDGPLPEIIYNLDRLPEPVRRMHDRLVEAAKSGDIEKLRPLIGLGEDVTQLSLGGVEGDPIAFLKGLSGDPDGQEILAIMEEVLSAGFVHLEPGTPNELYVWPYFFGIPLDKLDPRQRVELFKIVTAGDYEDMKTFGTYIFYRVGITPEGRWAFFVAGD